MEYSNKKKRFFSDLWSTNRDLYMSTSIVFFVGFLVAYVGDLLAFGFVIVGIGLSLSIGTTVCILAITIIKEQTGNFIGILGSLFVGTFISYALFDIQTAFVVSYAAPAVSIVTVLYVVKIIDYDVNVK